MHFAQDEKCQRFTAIGEVLARDVYAATMGDVMVMNRRDIAYSPCTEVSILPLIERLSFIADKRHWGAPFRFGMLEIPQGDYESIASLILANPKTPNPSMSSAARVQLPRWSTPSSRVEIRLAAIPALVCGT